MFKWDGHGDLKMHGEVCSAFEICWWKKCGVNRDLQAAEQWVKCNSNRLWLQINSALYAVHLAF